MTVRRIPGTLSLVGLLWGAPALAREGDAEACDGLEVGDDCTRSDGDAGVCEEDRSDPNVVVCEDGAGSGSADCGTAGGASLGGLALALGGLSIRRRRG